MILTRSLRYVHRSFLCLIPSLWQSIHFAPKLMCAYSAVVFNPLPVQSHTHRTAYFSMYAVPTLYYYTYTTRSPGTCTTTIPEKKEEKQYSQTFLQPPLLSFFGEKLFSFSQSVEQTTGLCGFLTWNCLVIWTLKLIFSAYRKKLHFWPKKEIVVTCVWRKPVTD